MCRKTTVKSPYINGNNNNNYSIKVKNTHFNVFKCDISDAIVKMSWYKIKNYNMAQMGMVKNSRRKNNIAR